MYAYAEHGHSNSLGLSLDSLPRVVGRESVPSGAVQVRSNQALRTISVHDNVGQQAVIVPIPRVGAASLHRALADLRRYRRYRAEWGGPRTAAANRESFSFAEQFLALIAASGKPLLVRAQIFVGGTAVLELLGPEVEAQLEFLPDGTIAANIDTQDGEWDDDVEGFTGTDIPAPIAQRLGIKVHP